MATKKLKFKPPNNPREALKGLNYSLGKLWNRKEDEPVNYQAWAKKYVKYLDGYVDLVEKTKYEPGEENDSKEPVKEDPDKGLDNY